MNASDLTIAQAATLIGIPNSPTMYNPVVNPDNALDRRNVVLSRMLTNGVITQEEYDAAKAEDLNLNVQEETGTNGVYLYKYFTSYVRDQILETYDHEQVFQGGLQIVTTIDPEMQATPKPPCRSSTIPGACGQQPGIRTHACRSQYGLH